MLLAWLFDGVLGLTLLALGARVVLCRDLHGAIMAFIGFGLLMAVAWLRLGALDVALAEAALGGGVSGALLLAALKRLRKEGEKRRGISH